MILETSLQQWHIQSFKSDAMRLKEQTATVEYCIIEEVYQRVQRCRYSQTPAYLQYFQYFHYTVDAVLWRLSWAEKRLEGVQKKKV